jgi:hypothetical protein
VLGCARVMPDLSNQNPRPGRFSASGIDLALGWTQGTLDRPKRSSESDFDPGATPQRLDDVVPLRVSLIGLCLTTIRSNQ